MTDSADSEPLEASKPNGFMRTIARIVLSPFRVLLWIIGRMILALLVCAVIAIPIGILLIVVDILAGLIDLIFRLHFRSDIHDWSTRFYDTSVMPVVTAAMTKIKLWSDQFGITAFGLRLGDELSDAATEIARALVLFAIFLVAGCGVYHLRIVHRVHYALLEFGVAIIAMWIAIDGMSGGDFSLKYLVALLSGLYVMVRALQNADEGFKEMAASELKRSESSGAGQASLEIWKAIFYDPYEKDSFEIRFDKIKVNSKIVFGKLFAIKQKAAEDADAQDGNNSNSASMMAPGIDEKIIDELGKRSS